MKNRQVEEQLQRMMTDEVPDYWDGICKKLPCAQPEEFTIVKKQSRRPMWITAASAAAVLALVMTVTLQGGRLWGQGGGAGVAMPESSSSGAGSTLGLLPSSSESSAFALGSESTGSSTNTSRPADAPSSALPPSSSLPAPSSVAPGAPSWAIPDIAENCIHFLKGTPGEILNVFINFAARKTEPNGTPMVDKSRKLFTQDNAYYMLTCLPDDYTIQSIHVEYSWVTIDYINNNDETHPIGFKFATAPSSYTYDFTNWTQRTVDGKSYYVSDDQPYSDLIRICWEEGGYYFFFYFGAAEGENYDHYFAYCNPEKLTLPQPDPEMEEYFLTIHEQFKGSAPIPSGVVA